MKLFKKNKDKIVSDDVLNTWAIKRLDSNLLRWGGFNTKSDYEHEEGKPFNKEKYIQEHRNELEKVYLIKTDPQYAQANPIADAYKRGTTIRSSGGERPLSAINKDRKYTSDENWEESYKRKRKSAVIGYKHHPEIRYKKSKVSTPREKPFVYTIGGL